MPGLVLGVASGLRAGEPPVITRHPVPQVAVAGQSVRFLAGSSDIFAAVQWERDGVLLSGASGPELRLVHVLPEDGGVYRAVFRNDRAVAGAPAAGESVSAEAALTVKMPPGSAGALDLTWEDPGLSARVRAVLGMADGGCLVAGDAGDPGLVRLRPDGTVDPDFPGGAGADDLVRVLMAHGDGWIAAGDFTHWSGVSRARMVRLLPDGKVDPGFVPLGLSGAVRCLGVQMVAGEARILAGLGVWPWLVRLRADGREDVAFSQAMAAAGLNSRVLALAVQADGQILIGGSFFADGKWPFARIGRLLADGAPDPGFPAGPGAGADFDVQALAIEPDGRILTGGKFTRLHGQSRFFLGRLLPDGRLDSGYDPAPNGVVNAVLPAPGGGALAGGEFTRVNGQTVRAVVRLAANGATDPAWSAAPLDGNVRTVSLTDGAVFCGGTFSQPHSGFVRLRAAPLAGPATVFPAPPRRTAVSGAGAILAAPLLAAPDILYAWSLDGEARALTQVPELALPVTSPADAGIWTVRVTDGTTVSWLLDVAVSSAGARPLLRVAAPGLPVPMPNEGVTTARFSLPGLVVSEARLSVSLAHYDTNDLALELVSPDGITVSLFDPSSGRRGRNFEDTTFADAAPDSVRNGAAPFTGTFRPTVGDPGLAALNGARPAGEWRLVIRDTRLDSQAGSLLAAVLEIRGPHPVLTPEQFAQAPPALTAAALSGGLFQFPHWSVPAGQGIYESSADLRGWAPLPGPPVHLRVFEDQQTLSTVPLGAGMSGFVRLRVP